jgi:quinol monooxygenase YgiN
MKTAEKILATTLFLTAMLGCGSRPGEGSGIREAPTTRSQAAIDLSALPSDPERQFVNLVSVKIKPELRARFLPVLLDYARQTRLEPGVARYDIHQSPNDPTVIEIYEVYKNTAARVAHNNTDHRNRFFAAVAAEGFFAQPAVQKVVYLIDPVDAE